MSPPDPGTGGPGDADLAARISAVAALNEPVRRALYAYVVACSEAVGREEAARAVGVTRELAAFHLDRLLDEGLLAVEFRRLTGRAGPGAGRPAKLYRPSGTALEVTLPPRRYALVADLLARALEEPDRELGGQADPARSVGRAARRFGEAAGAEARRPLGRRPGAGRLFDRACELLREHGFEPARGDGCIGLRNCPFAAVATLHTDVVCGMNLALVEGFLAGLRADGLTARLDPAPGMCCVAVGPTPHPSG